MKKILLPILSAVGIFACVASSNAQGNEPSILNISGGGVKIGYYDYEWSIGELCAIETFNSATNVILTQGVLQPCTDKVTPAPLILIFEKDEFKIFPNPTTGSFELNFMLRVPGRMKLQMHDNKGSLIDVREFRYEGCGRIEKYNIGGLPDGIYTIHATLTADERYGAGIVSVRNSGLRVVKLTNK